MALKNWKDDVSNPAYKEERLCVSCKKQVRVCVSKLVNRKFVIVYSSD